MSSITIALLGNPNCGKSTLFNALTGAKQQIGNWPGVTVERKTGYFTWQNHAINVIDLPGIYHLTTHVSAVDERITCETLLAKQFDIVINIVDATNLERNLYLTTQLLEMQVPVIVAVNLIDVAEKRAIKIDTQALAAQLNCPVLALSSTKKIGLQELKNTIIYYDRTTISKPIVKYPIEIEQAVAQLAQQLASKDASLAYYLRLLAGDDEVKHIALVENIQAEIEKHVGEEADIIIADARYRTIQAISETVIQRQSHSQKTVSQMIDRVVLHRVLGVPIFLAVMYSMFFFAINIGGAFQPFFDISSDTIFVQGLTQFLQFLHVPIWLIAVLAAGVGKGINTTITFIPIIGGLFLFLAFLEGCGYMARAAFVMDRFMRAIGLPGKSFVPMIVGFGCNVPAIMATRTLEDKRDRILTILMSPFMSCGARLAIYAVFTAAFFPRGGQNIVFALYMIGILIAVLTGLIVRKTVLAGEPSPLVMELPPYRLPTLRASLLQTWQRLKSFLFKAGKLIIPICVLMGALNSINTDGTLNIGSDISNKNSLLSTVGRAITPVFQPMGIEQHNWPATVGLLTGVLAKEVVVGSLNTLYTQLGNISVDGNTDGSILQGLRDAVASIPENLLALKDSFTNPVLASAPTHNVNQQVLGVMYSQFDGQIGAFAYLLFVLLYFPCISATAAMSRELNRGWTCFSVAWSTGIAYAAAVIFYQAATLARHPYSSISWIIALVLLFAVVLIIMRRYALQTTVEKQLNPASR